VLVQLDKLCQGKFEIGLLHVSWSGCHYRCGA
jgi:hypothetical protein